MKAFLLSLVFFIAVAALSGVVLETMVRRSATEAYSLPSARVEESNRVESQPLFTEPTVAERR